MGKHIIVWKITPLIESYQDIYNFLDSLTEQFKLGLTACHLSQYSVIIIFLLFNNFFLKLLLNMWEQLMSIHIGKRIAWNITTDIIFSRLNITELTISGSALLFIPSRFFNIFQKTCNFILSIQTCHGWLNVVVIVLRKRKW